MNEQIPSDGLGKIDYASIVNEDAKSAYQILKEFQSKSVRVKRSSGDIEDGWVVTGVEGQEIVVVKGINKDGEVKDITKKISVADFDALNS